jgi:hypothetical protein
MPDASGGRLRTGRRSARSPLADLTDERSNAARNYGAATLEFGAPAPLTPFRSPNQSSSVPQVAWTLRPAELIHREPVQPAVVAHPPVDVALQAPTRPAYLPVDVDRLDNELWRRFEKRVRIENERRGRG